MGRLGPHSASSSQFWQVINKTRTQKNSSGIPTLVKGEREYESDKDKANLFASSLGETFSAEPQSTDFCTAFYAEVEDYVANFDLSDSEYPEVTVAELLTWRLMLPQQ